MGEITSNHILGEKNEQTIEKEDLHEKERKYASNPKITEMWKKVISFLFIPQNRINLFPDLSTFMLDTTWLAFYSILNFFLSLSLTFSRLSKQ